MQNVYVNELTKWFVFEVAYNKLAVRVLSGVKHPTIVSCFKADKTLLPVYYTLHKVSYNVNYENKNGEKACVRKIFAPFQL